MACASEVWLRSSWSRLGSTEWSNFSCSISSMSHSHCGSMVRWNGSDPHVFRLPWANGLTKAGSSGNGRDIQEQPLSYKCFRRLQSLTMVDDPLVKSSLMTMQSWSTVGWEQGCVYMCQTLHSMHSQTSLSSPVKQQTWASGASGLSSASCLTGCPVFFPLHHTLCLQLAFTVITAVVV